jgi:hypothetical protein
MIGDREKFLLYNAVSFLEAAVIFASYYEEQKLEDAAKWMPFYYLLSHSTELIMKAALLNAGVQEKELKAKYRHNLASLLRECLQLNISFSDDFIVFIKQINQTHVDNTLRFLEPNEPDKDGKSHIVHISSFPCPRHSILTLRGAVKTVKEIFGPMREFA